MRNTNYFIPERNNRTEEEKRRLGICMEGPTSVFTESDSCKPRGPGRWVFKFGCTGNLYVTPLPPGFDIIDQCRDLTLSLRYKLSPQYQHYHHDEPKEVKEPPKHGEGVACYLEAQNDTCADNELSGLQPCRST